jgi:nitrogen fixation protein FixH
MRARQHIRPPRQITGRTVLVCLLSFFGVVAAVNAVMIRAATSTFGGVETRSSYQAGLTFAHEKAAAARQDDLHWNVTANLVRSGRATTGLIVAVRDENGRAVPDLGVRARLIHPADARRDHDVAMQSAGEGFFTGPAQAEAGQWDLQVDIYRGEERLFRSRSRVRVE